MCRKDRVPAHQRAAYAAGAAARVRAAQAEAARAAAAEPDGTPVRVPPIDWTPTGNPLAPARAGYGLTPPGGPRPGHRRHRSKRSRKT